MGIDSNVATLAFGTGIGGRMQMHGITQPHAGGEHHYLLQLCRFVADFVGSKTVHAHGQVLAVLFEASDGQNTDALRPLNGTFKLFFPKFFPTHDISSLFYMQNMPIRIINQESNMAPSTNAQSTLQGREIV